MLALHLVAEIRRLLAEGKLSRRRIARLVGVSRGTVQDIALGRRQYEPRAATAENAEPAGPPVRCPGCGGMVYLPCRLCEARRIAAHRGRRPFAGPDKIDGDALLALDLKEAHRVRYEEVRARREAAPAAGDECAATPLA
jgi:transcriptional regulator with XRE-family HTH domain